MWRWPAAFLQCSTSRPCSWHAWPAVRVCAALSPHNERTCSITNRRLLCCSTLLSAPELNLTSRSECVSPAVRPSSIHSVRPPRLSTDCRLNSCRTLLLLSKLPVQDKRLHSVRCVSPQASVPPGASCCPWPQIFYATIGASANVGLVVKTAPVLFLFSLLALAAHLAILLGVGRLLGFSRRELLIASNANIGGKGRIATARILSPGLT